MKLTLPAVWCVDLRHDDNIVRQLLTPTITIEGTAVRYTRGRVEGIVLQPSASPQDEILIVEKKIQVPPSIIRSIQAPIKPEATAPELDCSEGTWLKHPALRQTTTFAQLEGLGARALASWKGQFKYLAEDQAAGTPGLRNPQIGALHGILAHWSVTDEVGTIVMPTGTGKTETMLSALLAVPCTKVLVVVPTDALRTQISKKFLTLGILKSFQVIGAEALFPVVGVINRRPTTAPEVDELFGNANVIVTTSHIAGHC
jgi:hypothetical protein